MGDFNMIIDTKKIKLFNDILNNLKLLSLSVMK